MFSTTLTCLDASPRALEAGAKELSVQKYFNYKLWLIALSIGTTLIIAFFLKNMRVLVDLATSIAFLTAPFIAMLNYMAIKKAKIKLAALDKFIALIGFIYLQIFCLYYLYLKIIG
jgi:Mn2+/Fe2+ NRAMP family transporter